MCQRGNKITSLQHKCKAKQGMHAEGVQFFIAPQALIQQLYCYSTLFYQFLIQLPSEVGHTC